MRHIRGYVKLVAAFALLLILTVLGTILPKRFFAAGDERRMAQYADYETKPLVVSDTGSVPLEEKLKLIYGYVGSVKVVPVASEAAERAKMKRVAKRELKAMNRAGALPKGLKFLRKADINGGVFSKNFVINTQEPETTMYVWVVSLSALNKNNLPGEITLAIEEESGLVVTFDAKSHTRENWEEAFHGFSEYLRPHSEAYANYLSGLPGLFGTDVAVSDLLVFNDGYGAMAVDSGRLGFLLSSMSALAYNYSEDVSRNSVSVGMP